MKIDINNYEEIMFRLMEDDFDEHTRKDLLRQIESDALFKFEWDSWQKTKFVDPIENYAIESDELTEKIILIAEPQTTGKKRFLYYWAAAASIILLIGILFLLTSDFSSRPKQEASLPVTKSATPAKIEISPERNRPVPIAITDSKQTQKQKRNIKFRPLVTDSNKNALIENTLAEIPNMIDSIPVKTNELAKASEKKPRYTITIETSDISGSNQQSIYQYKNAASP